MAHFWTQINSDTYSGTALSPLGDEVDIFELTGVENAPVKVRGDEYKYSGPVLIREKTEYGYDAFFLLCAPGMVKKVRVNGVPLVAGIRLLKDRDEIAIYGCEGGAQRLYYSVEHKAKIVCLDETDHGVSCARCHQKISTGDQIVRCPLCGAVHHQSHNLPCWAYSSKCGNGMCSQSTVMGEEYRWIPDYLFRR